MEFIFAWKNWNSNIGIAIILYTIIIYLVLTPLQIKQQKMSKMMSVMQPDLQRIEKKYQNKKTRLLR